MATDNLEDLKRTALRKQYDLAFPAERAVSQRLHNADMVAGIRSGIAAVRPDASAVATVTSVTDENAVRTIAREVATDLDADMMGVVRDLIADAAKNAGARTLQVTRDGLTIGKVDGQCHYLLPKVASALAAGCHVFLVGPAGSGKTTLARQAAGAVGLRFLGPSIGPDTRSSRLVGFRSPTTGAHIEGIMRDMAVNGGTVLLDEADTAHPSVLPEMNALLANGHYVWGDGAETAISPDFRVIIGANTYGRGADAVYVGRSPIDGATLDRFVFVSVDYDPALERTLAGLAPDRDATARTYTPRTLTESDRETWVRRVFALRASANEPPAHSLSGRRREERSPAYPVAGAVSA